MGFFNMIQKVKRDGMITIPKKLREKANIQDGAYVLCGLKGNEIVFRVIDPTTLYEKLENGI